VIVCGERGVSDPQIGFAPPRFDRKPCGSALRSRYGLACFSERLRCVKPGISREQALDAGGEAMERGTDQKPTPFGILRRTVGEFREDNLADWAAALTYYSVLALFPALLVLVSIVGLFADPQATAQKLTEIVASIGPSSGAQTFSGPIRSITSNHSTAGVLLVVGLLGALWSASGYVGAFTRASNVIYETPEGRPFWKLRPLQLLITLGIVLLVAILALSLILTGPVVDAVAGPLGIGSTATTIWDVAKWPLMLAVVMLIVAVLYYATPNVKIRGFRWVTPGSVVAVVVWLIVSALFALYVANFGSYDKTYGTLGGVIVMLMWFWITNLAILFGQQLNAERERGLELADGTTRAEREIQLEPRAEPDDQ
jgi:membrane protein